MYKHKIRLEYRSGAFYVKNFSMHIDGVNIFIKNIYLYRLGLEIEGLMYDSKPLFFYLKDGIIHFHNKLYTDVDDLNIVLVAQNNKPSNVPDFNIGLYERFYKYLNMSVKNLYIQGADRFSYDAFSLSIPRVYLKNGIFYTKGYTHYTYLGKNSKTETYVFVPKAFLKDGYFIAQNVNAVSDLFDFNLNFKWRHRIGYIAASGFIMPIKTSIFSTSTLSGTINGNINNKTIHFNGDFKIGYIDIPHLKPIKNSTFNLKGITSDNGTSFSGILRNDLAMLNINYKDIDNTFNIKIQKLLLNNKYLTLKYPINIYAGGKLYYSVNKKVLKINLKASNIKIYKWSFGMGLLKGVLDFKKENPGALNYALYGKQNTKGQIVFQNNNIFTKTYLNNFILSYKTYKARIDGFIQTNFNPLVVEGFITISDLNIPYTSISEIPINLSYKNNTLTLTSDSPYLKGFLTYKNNIINAQIYPKHLMVYKTINGALYSADLTEGIINMQNKNISIQNISFNTSNAKGFYVIGYINGVGSIDNLSGNIHIIKANYSLLKDIKGDVMFDYKNSNLNLRPSLREKNFLLTSNINIYHNISFSAKIAGANKVLSIDLNINGFIDNKQNINLNGFIVYKNTKIPILAYIKNYKDKYSLYIKGFHIKYSSFNINIDSIKGSSQGKEIIWNTNGFDIKLYHQSILSTSPISGVLNLKPFYIKSNTANLNGILNGNLVFGYDKNIFINSNGIIDVDDTVAFMKSKLPFLLKGNINYSANINDSDIYFSFKSQKPVMLLSKYISLPLYSDVNFTIKTNENGYFHPVVLSFYSEDKKHNIIFNVFSDKNGIYIKSNLHNTPIYMYNKNWYYQGFVQGNINGNYLYNNFHPTININGDLNPGGLVYIKSFESSYKSSTSHIPKNLNMNVLFENISPLTIMLPEGNVYSNVKGKVFAKNGNLGYDIYMKALGGTLTYSGKTFYIRQGNITLKSTKKYGNLLLISPGDSYNTYIYLNGDLSDPNFNIYSEPPIPKEELLSSFILNQSSITAIPINTLAKKYAKYSPSGIVSKIFGTNINLSVYPSQSANGNMNTTMELQKKIAKNIKLKAHISTSQNPLDTYYGGSIKLTPNTSLDMQMYGNGSSQGSMSYEKHFDFGH